MKNVRHLRRVIAAALVLSGVGMLWLFGARIEPSALLLRTYLDKFASATAVETDHYAPATTISRKANQNYGGGGSETSFDVYRLKSAGKTVQPTIIWLHGGGWVGGSKDFVAPYLRKMASAGFTVIGLNYPLAPSHEYPGAVKSINSAFDYIFSRALFYGVDASRLVLAGNEAGANLASEIAGLTTNPDYAAEVGLTSRLSATQLKGVILDGGVFDLNAAQSLGGLARWRLNTELWAYTGTQNAYETPTGAQISTVRALSAQFPATWMTAGDLDHLTQNQSIPFAAQLAAVGGSVTTIFPDQGANLPADYQFMLALPAAKRAFGSMLDFISQVTSSQHLNAES